MIALGGLVVLLILATPLIEPTGLPDTDGLPVRPILSHLPGGALVRVSLVEVQILSAAPKHPV